MFDETQSKRILLLNADASSVAVFESMKEIELFQLRIGLKYLCQNTLAYHSEKDSPKYEILPSPHSRVFYVPSCRNFCANTQNIKKCEELTHCITAHFLDEQPLNGIKYKKFLYDSNDPDKYYIGYICPYVGLYKFAFPIYVEKVAVAVLFVGQFDIEPTSSTISLPAVFRKNFLRGSSSRKATFHYSENHIYSSESELECFIDSRLKPAVVSFASEAAENYQRNKCQQFNNMLEKQLACTENDLMLFLTNMSKMSGMETQSTFSEDAFWKIATKNLVPLLGEIKAKRVILFMEKQYVSLGDTSETIGLQIYPCLSPQDTITVDFESILQRESSNIGTHQRLYLAEDSKSQKLLACFSDANNELSFASSDAIFHFEKMQSFALLVDYCNEIETLHHSYRENVLIQLERFMAKVGQQLVYYHIRLSEAQHKTVLRVYRHEILHQITVLQNNNSLFDAKLLREIDENKLRHVAEDQRQCLYELAFMTENIAVLTGQKDKQIVGGTKEIDIDLKNDLLNKIISLYERQKRDKVLWFSVQNKSVRSTLRGNLELLDIILFNLMSNAIKYAFSGTKIIIGVDDTNSYGRPHRISITDFGSAVSAENHNQVFQMYYRGQASDQTEGSGLGLFVAYKVASIIDAELSWESQKISDYNIPMVLRYLNLPADVQARLGIDCTVLQAELIRLQENLQVNRIVNEEFLMHPSGWNEEEIVGEIFEPTYEVTFYLNL